MRVVAFVWCGARDKESSKEQPKRAEKPRFRLLRKPLNALTVSARPPIVALPKECERDLHQMQQELTRRTRFEEVRQRAGSGRQSTHSSECWWNNGRIVQKRCPGLYHRE